MKNQTPTQYFFDLIEKELKEYEEKLKRKNDTVPAKNKKTCYNINTNQ